MAKLESGYVQLCKLYGNANGGPPKQAHGVFSGQSDHTFKEHFRVYNGNEIVYDKIINTLIVPDIDEFKYPIIPASGGTLIKPDGVNNDPNETYLYDIIKDYIDSYSVDVEGQRQILEYELFNDSWQEEDENETGTPPSPYRIPPNKSESNTPSYNIRARQYISGLESTFTMKQHKESMSEQWHDPYVDYNEGVNGCRLVNEDGGDNVVYADGTSKLKLQVYVTQQKQIDSESGTQGGNNTYQEWRDADIIYGNSFDGGYWNKGYFYADNRGIVEGDVMKIFEVTKVSYTGFDGKTYYHDMWGEYALSVPVYQEANTLAPYGNEMYTFNLQDDYEDVELSASAQSYEIHFTSQSKRKQKYTSGEPGPDTSPTYKTCTASITKGQEYASLESTSDKFSFKLNIQANESETESREIEVAIDDANGGRYYATFIQLANEITTRINNVEFDHIEIEFMNGGSTSGYASAAGDRAYIYVILKETYVNDSSNGINAGSPPATYKYASIVKVTNGDSNGSVSISNNDGQSQAYISFSNLGTDGGYQYNAYTINELYWYYKSSDNREWSENYNLYGSEAGPITVTQEQNTVVSTRTTGYTIDISGPDELEAYGGNYTINVSCGGKKYSTYASGKEDDGVYENEYATLSTSYGLFRANSTASSSGDSIMVLGGKTCIFTPHENSNESSRNVTITGKCDGDASVTDTLTISQKGSSYDLTVNPSSISAPYGGGNYNVEVIVSKNGNSISSQPIASSTATWTDIDWSGYDVDWKSASVVVNSNSGGARSATITIKHPIKLTLTKSISVGQSGVPASSVTYSMSEVETSWNSNTLNFGFMLNMKEDNEYKYEGIEIEVKVQADDGENNQSYGSTTVSGITSLDRFTGSIECDYQLSQCYLCVYLDGKLIESAYIS